MMSVSGAKRCLPLSEVYRLIEPGPVGAGFDHRLRAREYDDHVMAHDGGFRAAYHRLRHEQPGLFI